MNIALHGFEQVLVNAVPQRTKDRKNNVPGVIRYADDLVVLHHDLDTLIELKRPEEARADLHEILEDQGRDVLPQFAALARAMPRARLCRAVANQAFGQSVSRPSLSSSCAFSTRRDKARALKVRH